MKYLEWNGISSDGLLMTWPQIHFSDPAAYHEIHSAKVRWNKAEFLYHSLGENGSAFGSLSVEDAKPRKSTLAPPFSRRAVSSYNDLLKHHVRSFIVTVPAVQARSFLSASCSFSLPLTAGF